MTKAADLGIKAGLLLDADDWRLATAHLSKGARERVAEDFVAALEGGDLQTARALYTSALWAGVEFPSD